MEVQAVSKKKKENNENGSNDFTLKATEKSKLKHRSYTVSTNKSLICYQTGCHSCKDSGVNCGSVQLNAEKRAKELISLYASTSTLHPSSAFFLLR